MKMGNSRLEKAAKVECPEEIFFISA